MRATSRAPLALKIGGAAHRTHPRRSQKERGAAARLPLSVAQPPPTRTPRPAGAPTRNRPRRPPRALRRGPDAPGPWECYPPRARAAPTRLVRSLGPPRAPTRHGANGRMGPHPRRPGARAAAQWPGVMWGQHRGAGGGLLCTGPHRLGGLPLRRGAGEETQTLTEDCYRSSNGKRKRPKPYVGKSISDIGFQGFCRTPKTEVRSLLQSNITHSSLVEAGGSAVCGCLAALAAAPPRRYVAVESARRPRRSSRPSAWRERRPVRGVRAAERPAPVGAYTSWKVCG